MKGDKMIKKTRNIGLILYQDNKMHMEALEYIKKNYQYYIYILHDRDFDENGNHKKIIIMYCFIFLIKNLLLLYLKN